MARMVVIQSILLCSFTLSFISLYGMDEKKNSGSNLEQLLDSAPDYTPALVGLSSALYLNHLAILTMNSLMEDPHMAMASGAGLSLLLVPTAYVAAGTATDCLMKRLGHTFQRFEQEVSKDQLHPNYLQYFGQLLHPKNLGLLVRTLSIKFGLSLNRGVVMNANGNILYRSAQPKSESDWRKLLQEERCRTYVNFQGSEFTDNKLWQLQKKIRKEFGIPEDRMYNISFKGQDLPTPDQVEKMVTILRTGEYPMHVNCRHGNDYAGLFAGLALLEIKRTSLDEALEGLGYEEWCHVETELPLMRRFVRKWHKIRKRRQWEEGLGSSIRDYKAWHDGIQEKKLEQ